MMKGLLIKLLVIGIALHAALICTSAQRRQIAEARSLIKSGQKYAEAEKLMTTLLKDSANQGNKRIYDLWLLAVEKQYGELNEKMYKHQAIDTTKLFDLTSRIFMIAERLDSIDMRPDKKGRVDPEYRKDNAERLMGYRPNLFFGGTYYLRKSAFQNSFKFFEEYIDCARQPLFTSQNLMAVDSRMGEAAYWSSYCGYRSHDPVLTLRYLELARRDTAKLEFTLQYAAESYLILKDGERHLETLWEGFRSFPKSSYFFPRLTDYYTSKGNFEQALAIADDALQADSLNELFLFAKSTALLNLGKYAQSLDYSRRLIALNEQMADAYYNAGTACLNIVLNMDSRKHKKQIKKMYQNAQSYMEDYRRLEPQEQQKWGPALYRIYFNLNLGKQFDEIDKILKK